MSLLIVFVLVIAHFELGAARPLKIPFEEGARHWRNHDQVREFVKGVDPETRPQTTTTTSVLLYSLRNSQRALSKVQYDTLAGALMWEAFTREKELLAANLAWDQRQDTESFQTLFAEWTNAVTFLERSEVQLWLDRSKPLTYEVPASDGIGLSFLEHSADVPSNEPDPSKVTITLNNGVEMPLLGFGTWMLGWQNVVEPVKMAIEAGYRRFETSNNYMNEPELGQLIAESEIERDQFFITTTIHSEEDFGTDETRALVEKQLDTLGFEYIDLYMIHGPINDKQRQKEAWQTMEALYEEGKIRALGVSNYEENELDMLLKYAHVVPAVVQNKFDVYSPGWYHPNSQRSMIQKCLEHNIQLVGYSTLNTWPFDHQPMADPHVREIALRLGLTPAQVLLRWGLQNGASMIPRSTNRKRIEENASVFSYSLDDETMRLLNGIMTFTVPFAEPVQYVEDVYGLRVLDDFLVSQQTGKAEL